MEPPSTLGGSGCRGFDSAGSPAPRQLSDAKQTRRKSRGERVWKLPSGTILNLTTTLRRNMEQFRGVLVFNAHRLLYHSTLGSRVIKKKKKKNGPRDDGPLAKEEPPHKLRLRLPIEWFLQRQFTHKPANSIL